MRVIRSTALLAVAAAAVHALPVNYPIGFEQGPGAKAPSDHEASPPPPATTAAPSPAAVKRAIDQLTVTITNQHTAAITTRHAIHPGVPKPVDAQKKEVKEGKIEKGGKGVYVVSPEYIGTVFINDAKFPPSQHSTQVEVSMKMGKKGFDVSNVTGFTLPVICRCEAANGAIYESGCGFDLVAEAKKDPSKACKVCAYFPLLFYARDYLHSLHVPWAGLALTYSQRKTGLEKERECLRKPEPRQQESSRKARPSAFFREMRTRVVHLC